jgi:hypothetical protein
MEVVMTGPMFNPGQQAASSAWQQSATQAHRDAQRGIDHASQFAGSQGGYRRGRRPRGVFGWLARLVMFAVWLAVMAVVVVIGLAVLHHAGPHLPSQLNSN